MSLVEAFRRIQAPLITVSKIVGVEIWTSDKLLQPASYVLIAHIIIYNVCNIYTVLKYASDPMKLMQILTLFGIATQLTFKYFDSLSKKKQMRSLFVLVETHIYSRYSDGVQEEKVIVARTTRYLEIIWKLLAMMYSATLFVFVMWPINVYLTEGHLIPLFMYEIPGVDPEQSMGYVVTLLFQLDMYIIGIIGLFMVDYFFIFICLQVLSAIDLFILHMKMLGSLLTANIHEKDQEAIAAKWKDCMLDLQFATGLLNGIESVSSLSCLVQLYFCIFTICDAMLLVTLTDWYAAFCFLLVIFAAMTILFIVGIAIELKIDEMYEAITALPWNLLSVSQQKEFAYLLARSQRPLNITCYGFAPLNFETYASVLKAQYQFFVLVLQYIK